MNKTLGILIPYYKNSPECEIQFKKLIKTLIKQIYNNDIHIIVYEDGQYSEWLDSYHFVKLHKDKNYGVAHARNCLLGLARLTKLDYILYLDSDDMIDCDFIPKMYDAICTDRYYMITSGLYINKQQVFQPVRADVAGITLRTEFVKGIDFDEEYNISEDTIFINEVYNRNPRQYQIDSIYHYNYGVNPNSLMMRFERSEIKLKRDDNNE